jgi:N-acetylmuramoyl-L-alanine amidase
MQIANKYISLITKRIPLLVLAIIVLLLTNENVYSQEVYKLRKVVIDPGHGGKDSGAMGRKSKEKDIVLAVGLKLGKYIEENFSDVEVIYTRKEDVFVRLEDRGKLANEVGADLFISIHCNANPSKTPYGTETYVMGLHKSQGNLEVAMRENAVITYEEDYTTRYEGYDPNSAESFIIFSLIQNAFLDQSLEMASLVQNEFRERARRRDRGVKQAGFVVLWQNSMPSVLVELGFLSNPKEEDYLVTPEAQTYLASAIYRAFKEYKSLVESRSTFTAESRFNEALSKDQGSGSAAVSSQWTSNTPQIVQAKFIDGLEYKVQITVSSNPLSTNSVIFQKIKNVEELSVDGLYKYVVGSNSSYSESVEFCQKVREHFPDAFIVAFKNGKQIPLDQARKISSN